MRAVVVDYGAGNLRSIENALGRLGCEALLAAGPDDVRKADRIVLPGVGSLASGMTSLAASGMDDALRDAAGSGVPILGICLGMQMLMEHGSEGGSCRGLGLVRGGAVPLSPGPGFTLPHTGWNSLRITREVPLLEGIREGSCFYFVHSYAVEPSDPGVVCAVTEHGRPFPSVISWGSVSGVQFHPEKSQADGARLLDNFLSCGWVR